VFFIIIPSMLPSVLPTLGSFFFLSPSALPPFLRHMSCPWPATHPLLVYYLSAGPLWEKPALFFRTHPSRSLLTWFPKAPLRRFSEVTQNTVFYSLLRRSPFPCPLVILVFFPPPRNEAVLTPCSSSYFPTTTSAKA